MGFKTPEEFAESVAQNARDYRDWAEKLNFEGRMVWAAREQVRAIGGHLTKIDDLCWEILSASEDPKAEGIMTRVYGPL